MCRLPRAVCESVGERWRDRAGSLRTVGIRSHRWLHTCWHGRSARPMARPPRSGGGSEPAAAHSLRECRGAMARPRRQLAYRGYPVTPMVAHIMMLARAVGAADRSTTEKRRRGSSRWMSGRACVCLYGYTRKSIGSKRQAKCGMERAVATVGCRVKAIAKGVAACVSCEHACTGLLHA